MGIRSKLAQPMMAGSEVAGTRAHGSDHGFGGEEVIVELERGNNR
jgi:hypothetical protein